MIKTSYPVAEWPLLRAAFLAITLLFSVVSAADAARSVTLAWDPSPEADLAGYHLKYGTARGVYDQSIDVKNVTKAPVSNLADDREYYFVVTAYNTAGLVSAPSNEVTLAVVPPVVEEPEPPVDEYRSITLAWNPSPETDVAGYRLRYGTASGVYDQTIDVKKVTTAPVPGLARDRAYFFVVTAYNTAGLVSSPSNEVVLPPSESTTPVPQPPNYDDWSTQLPVSQRAATADPDHDGLSNLLEYALGRSPDSPETSPILDLKVDGSTLTVSFSHPSDRTNIVYTLQESKDLVTWTAVTDTTKTGDTESLVHTLKRNLNTNARLYYRLVVKDNKGATATASASGVNRTTIAGVTSATGSTATTMFGLSLMQPAVYRGSAETVTRDTISDLQAKWTNGQFEGTNGAYVLEITSGPAVGTSYDILQTSAQNKTIRLAQALASGATNGVTFEIRKHWTLGSVFGPANEAGLASGNETTADRVLLWSGNTNVQYYYLNTSAGKGWRRVGNATADQANVVIYPEDGISVQRKRTGDVATYLCGAVKTWNTSIPVSRSWNVLANVYSAPMTLESSGLYTGNALTGVKSASVQTSADHVTFWNGRSYDVYWYRTGSGWRQDGVNNPNPGATVIPPGAAVRILRRGTVGFNWIVPTHPTTK